MNIVFINAFVCIYAFIFLWLAFRNELPGLLVNLFGLILFLRKGMKMGSHELSKVGMRLGLSSKVIVTLSKVSEPRQMSWKEFKV